MKSPESRATPAGKVKTFDQPEGSAVWRRKPASDLVPSPALNNSTHSRPTSLPGGGGMGRAALITMPK
jgi:hypothetical protein